MRLIDADAFEKTMTDKILPALIEKYGEEEAVKGLHFSFQDCISNIQGEPTIEPMRKKGKWVRRLVDSGFNADWHCSECGWKTALEEHGYNYCPNCGAEMREPD